MKMYKHYDGADKKKFLFAKLFTSTLIVIFSLVAIYRSDVEIVTFNEKMGVSIGAGLVILLAILAATDIISKVIRNKTVAFLTGFIILFLLRNVITTLILGFGLLSIPLFINDAIVRPYFNWLNHKKYWEIYKYMVERDG